jgi:hypothetical protein
MRKEIERDTINDGRVSQKGDLGPIGRTHDSWGNPFGHDVCTPSPVDSDPKTHYTVPDCAYKGYDSYTWPEGKADDKDLPCCMAHEQSEDMKR